MMLEDLIQQLTRVIEKLIKGEELTEDERLFAVALFEAVINHMKDYDNCVNKLSEITKKANECENMFKEVDQKFKELKDYVDQSENKIREKLRELDNLIKILQANPRLLPKN
ncbi:hypothetical protein V6M85_02645 [Sulfolobus tengchongensis]|uniref:Uncharacterized protein n=1 Tax=Sulfolobus tengchongensis TaxID=207809 RepID=A0AAX4L1B0_9CREN